MDPAALRQKAEECRQLAAHADEGTAANLLMIAEDYDRQATDLEGEAE